MRKAKFLVVNVSQIHALVIRMNCVRAVSAISIVPDLVEGIRVLLIRHKLLERDNEGIIKNRQT